MKIETNGYNVEMTTAKTVAEAMEKLPVFQSIRGAEQWNAEKREKLIADILAGCYVPPIAYGYVTDEDGNKSLAIMDGQQRGNAIREAVADGRLSPDTEILISIDKLRAGEELFRVLNIGVPVGSALVTAVALNGNAGKALLAVASHAALSYVPWSAIQTGRTEKAAFAASLLAVASGWNAPESSTKVAEAWLNEHSAEITADNQTAALAMCDKIADALKPYVDAANGEDKKRAKVARKVLGGVRKKNNWITLCQLVKDDIDASDAVALFADGETWCKADNDNKAYGKGKYRRTSIDGKGGRIKEWSAIPMGGGSSGNATDAAKRLDAALFFIVDGGDFQRNPYAEIDAKDKQAKAADKAAAGVDGDTLAALMGGAM